MSFTIDTGDVVQASTRLGDLADPLGDVSAPLRTTADEVARLAGPRTPRRSGRLASSVSVAAEGTQARIRWGVGYAVFVNFGTRRMRAQPFATDALEAAKPVLERAATDWATGLVSSTG